MRQTLLCAAAILAVLPSAAFADTEAASADPKYTWDLTDLYASDDEWNRAREAVLAEFPKIEARRGTLGDSADSLYRAYREVSDTFRQAGRVYAYAKLASDEDKRDDGAREHLQLARILFSQFNEATAWMQPELISVGREVIDSYLREDERLAPFAHQFDDSLRNAPHTLGTEAEQALAYLTPIVGAPQETWELLARSDIPWPTITLSDGEKVVLDTQGYSRVRSSRNRADRKLAFDEFWGKWLEYRNSVGMVLNTHIRTQVGLARARNYDSVLERELFSDNIPPAVYRTLVEEVNKALPTLYRYFRLRARMLGIEQMHYYDIYPPLVSLDKTFDIDKSKEITLAAMSILGDDWVAMQKQAMGQRWMHVYPQRGKAPGAYMAGYVYDVHPYLLFNYNDDYASLSTFAHEWGHAMHTLYAKQSQPFETAGYSTFIAEIPSTSLELILQDYMAKHAGTTDEKLFYLGQALEDMRGTFFRQTMFAEFELALYEAAERGEALTGERISKMYGEILRRYHGQDQGVVQIDDLYTNEWMFVPHFYYNMYVYQYATSLTAGTALYAKIADEGPAGVANFKDLLRAGGSDYPYLLLLRAGVDLAKPGPYRAVVAKMNAIMDEMDRLLAAREKNR